MALTEKLVCTEDDRTEDINPEQARLVGWRVGTTAGGKQVAYCPECTGVDEGYWDRRTLDMAYAAGIDAGNTAWGGA